MRPFARHKKKVVAPCVQHSNDHLTDDKMHGGTLLRRVGGGPRGGLTGRGVRHCYFFFFNIMLNRAIFGTPGENALSGTFCDFCRFFAV